MSPVRIAALLLLPLAFGATCPPGFKFEDNFDKCYMYVSNKTSFFTAMQTCYSVGGTLVTVTNSYENAYVVTQSAGTTAASVWIGMNNVQTTKWGWISGAPVGYKNWVPGQPQTPTYYPCAAASNTDNKWRQEACGNSHSFMCEAVVDNDPPTTTAVPLPCPPKYCSDGYTLFPGNHMCYKYNRNIHGTDDIELCNSENATLVKIDSADLNAFLLSLSIGFAPAIGLSCHSDNEEDCYWFDGTRLTGYSNFQPGEPGGMNGQFGPTNRTIMSTGLDAGTWCTYPYWLVGSDPVLCQKSADATPPSLEESNSHRTQQILGKVDKHGRSRH